jgi:hypothetical protein
MSKRFGGTKISNKGKIYDINASVLSSESSLLGNMISDLGDTDDVIPLEVDGKTFDVIESYIKTKKLPKNVDIDSLLTVANYLEMTPLINEIYKGMKDGVYKFTPAISQEEGYAKWDIIQEFLGKYMPDTTTTPEILKLAKNTNLYPFIEDRLIKQKKLLPEIDESVWDEDEKANYQKLVQRLYPAQIITKLPIPKFDTPHYITVETSGDGELVVVYSKRTHEVFVLEGLQNTKVNEIQWPSAVQGTVKLDYITKEIWAVTAHYVRYFDNNNEWITSQYFDFLQFENVVVNNGVCSVQTRHSIQGISKVLLIWYSNGLLLHKIIQSNVLIEKWNLGPKYITTSNGNTTNVWNIYQIKDNDLELKKIIPRNKNHLAMIGLQTLWFDQKESVFYLGEKKLFNFPFNSDFLPNVVISPNQSKFIAMSLFGGAVIYNFNNSEKWFIHKLTYLRQNQQINDCGLVYLTFDPSKVDSSCVYVPYRQNIRLPGNNWYLNDFYAVKYDHQSHSIIQQKVNDPSVVTKFNQNS